MRSSRGGAGRCHPAAGRPGPPAGRSPARPAPCPPPPRHPAPLRDAATRGPPRRAAPGYRDLVEDGLPFPVGAVDAEPEQQLDGSFIADGGRRDQPLQAGLTADQQEERPKAVVEPRALVGWVHRNRRLPEQAARGRQPQLRPPHRRAVRHVEGTGLQVNGAPAVLPDDPDPAGLAGTRPPRRGPEPDPPRPGAPGRGGVRPGRPRLSRRPRHPAGRRGAGWTRGGRDAQ